ncbi:MAG: hypothetical protein ACHQ8D_14650 [Candidatus Rokuibacteriota bacterium]|jgi:hypothetical protein
MANRCARFLLPLPCLLALVTPTSAGGSWMLAEIGKQGALVPVSGHATLTECLSEQRSREEIQRAYLRAAGEASPQDQLPVPVVAASYRCLPDTAEPRGPGGK